MNTSGSDRHWHRLVTTAQDEVKALLAALPREVRGEARGVPVSYEPRPNQRMIDDDAIEPDTLGLFVGQAMPDSESGAQDLPPQVLLFLENIWDYAGHDAKIYREEIRTTFLHELGHFLGLDEDGLADRELD